MNKRVAIAIVAATGLSVLLYLAPITKPDRSEPLSDLDRKVEEAITIVQSADGAPMQGIAMLREVLQEEPGHVKANLWMGYFSIQSGQFDKAVTRFETVLNEAPDHAEAAKQLASVLLQLQQTEKAKNVLGTFMESNPDHEANAEMQDILNNI